MLKGYFQWLKQVLRARPKYLYLRRYLLFKDLSQFELYLVQNYLHERKYQPGEIIFEQDYPLETVFFIQKGEVEVKGKLSAPQGTILKRYQFIGLIDLFADNKRSSSAKALTEVNALALSRNDFQTLVEHSPRLGAKLLTAACRFTSNFVLDFIATGQQ